MRMHYVVLMGLLKLYSRVILRVSVKASSFLFNEVYKIRRVTDKGT